MASTLIIGSNWSNYMKYGYISLGACILSTEISLGLHYWLAIFNMVLYKSMYGILREYRIVINHSGFALFRSTYAVK